MTRARTPGLGQKDRCLIVMRHAAKPMTTAEIATAVGAASGVIAARMLDLAERDYVERIDGRPAGRGGKAVWRLRS